jgi:serine/threonine protein kinase/DNA-binding winged helix-turn-helix (wHTH) protein
MYKNNKNYLEQPYALVERYINPISGVVVFKNNKTSIRRKELEILALLCSESGNLVERSTFIELLWNDDFLIGDPGLTRAIGDLRNTIEDKNKSDPIISTIPRKGYKLNFKPEICKVVEITQFTTGDKIPSIPGWELDKLLSKSKVSETWLLKNDVSTGYRFFRFIKNEKHLKAIIEEKEFLLSIKNKLKNRNDIVIITNWGLDNPPYFLEFSYTEYGSLKYWNDSSGGLIQLSLNQKTKLLLQIAEAIDAVHSNDIIHQNISPNSIFLDSENGLLIAKLGEFAISKSARRIESNKLKHIPLTSDGQNINYCYLSPARRENKYSTKECDIYSFGVLAYQILMGNLNSDIPSHWQNKIQNEKLKEIIFSCLQRNSQDRNNSHELSDKLNQLLFEFEPDNSEFIKPASRDDENFIGPYRLLELIGEGGMGSVYLAEQKIPVHRKVAIKLVKNEITSKLSLARFESERQTLAIMNHINVASVFDAGENEKGQQYFVMEYVAGERITDFCDKNKLNILSRLKLFLQICQGVLHAHQKGVIHRDINPNNILVKTSETQDPIVKIIDFGVAKSLQGSNSPEALHTQLGVFVGTLLYSSPEQIEGSKLGVDTRSDIYSLGVVLYQLLVGITPFESQQSKAITPVNLVKLITEQTIPKPSKKIISLTEKFQHKIAENRSIRLNKLRKLLDNELTWVTLKCLEPDRNNRYGSVLELINDLNRFINYKPVEARKANKLYHIKKFYLRHTSASLLVSMLVVGLVISSWLAYSGYTKSQIALNEARILMDFQTKQLRRIEPFLIGKIFKYQMLKLLEENEGLFATKDQARQVKKIFNQIGANIFTDMAREYIYELILEPSLKTINEEYNHNPIVKAKLYINIAEFLFEISIKDPAIDAINNAIDILEQQSGQEKKLLFKAYRIRGSIKHDLSLLKEAIDDFKLAYKGNIQIHGENNEETLLSAFWLGIGYYRVGNYNEALKILNATIDKQKQFLGPEHYYTIASTGVLGNIYLRIGKYQQAMELIKSAYKLTKINKGDDHPTTLSIKSNLAVVYINLEKHDEAIIKLREVLSIRLKTQGKKNSQTFSTQNLLARALIAKGEYEEGIEISKNVLALVKLIMVSPNISEMNASHNLGQALFLAGDNERAEELIQYTIEGREEIFGENHLDTNKSKLVLAEIKMQQNKLKEARQLFLQPLDFYLKNYGVEHDRYLQIKNKYDLISEEKH